MSQRPFAKLALASAAIFILAAPAAEAGAIHDAGLFTTVLPANDDGSTASVGIGFSIDFYGSSLGSLFVNNNGNVTFSGPLSTYTPFGITGVSTPMLAPFFADVDTGAGNTVTYGTNVLGGKNVFGVNWIDVGYFASHTDKLNSFQLIITDRSDVAAGDFDFEFNYDKIAWETGDASGGTGGLGGVSAAAGWTNGTGTYYEFPGSRANGAFLDGGPDALIASRLNSTVDGQYIFRVRNGAVVSVPEPATLVLLGLGLIGVTVTRRRAS